jgi:tRNA threonylcarbamoyladenosine biosynthesis protein TsaE
MIEVTTRCERETARLGALLAGFVQAGDTLLLMGEMGSGKSVLARGLGRALGVSGPMASPTFTLMQPYPARIPLYHFDLYRLEDYDEFEAAGLHEFIGGDGVALVEWPEQAEVCPPRRMEIRFERDFEDDLRKVRIECFDMERAREIERAVQQWEEAK